MKKILNIFFDVSFLLLERIISHLGHIIYQNFFFYISEAKLCGDVMIED